MTAAGAALRLQSVRVGELPEFARHALQDSACYEIVPITVQRAEAQVRNPAASPDDVGLIVAYLEDRCVGYLGLFPVWLEERDQRRKVLSLSTYFVGHEHRGTGAGALLLLHAVSLGHDLFVAGISDVAARVCQGVGFRPAGPVAFLNLRIDAVFVLPLLLGRLRHGLGSQGPGFVLRGFRAARKLSRRTVETTLRPLVIRLLQRPLRARREEIVMRPVESVRSPEGLRQVEPSQGRSRFVRGDAIVNWMIHHPWITEDPSVRLNYAFSYRRELFRFLPFELRAAASGQHLGYVVLRVSADAERTVLTILDHVLVDERHRQGVLGLALQEALRWSADRIECGEEFGFLLRSSFLHRVLTRRERRGCLVYTQDRSGSCMDRPHELKVGICDGDASFA
jgi:GNAT superfamily N-acetyltransferase